MDPPTGGMIRWSMQVVDRLSRAWLSRVDAHLPRAVAASRTHHDQLAREMTAELQAAGLRAEADRQEGDAATEILAAAGASDSDLIVMGTRGRTGLARLVLGSVARNVLQHATCSVLVIREGPPQAE